MKFALQMHVIWVVCAATADHSSVIGKPQGAAVAFKQFKWAVISIMTTQVLPFMACT